LGVNCGPKAGNHLHHGRSGCQHLDCALERLGKQEETCSAGCRRRYWRSPSRLRRRRDFAPPTEAGVER
jgi:hypothetical protein